MKSRLKKQLIRSIASRALDMRENKSLWDDKDDEFYAPFIQQAVSLGLFPETWSYSKKLNDTFIILSFVYTYMTSSGKVKNDIGYIDISSYNKLNDSKVLNNSNVIQSDKEKVIIFSRENIANPAYGKISSFHIKTTTIENIFTDIMPIISEHLSKFHKTKMLFSGSLSYRPKKEINNRGIVISILESHWDYAVRGITYMYKMKDKGEFTGIEDGFEKFTISDEDIQFFKDEYHHLKNILLCSSGKSFTENVIQSFERKSRKNK